MHGTASASVAATLLYVALSLLVAIDSASAASSSVVSSRHDISQSSWTPLPWHHLQQLDAIATCSEFIAPDSSFYCTPCPTADSLADKHDGDRFFWPSSKHPSTTTRTATGTTSSWANIFRSLFVGIITNPSRRSEVEVAMDICPVFSLEHQWPPNESTCPAVAVAIASSSVDIDADARRNDSTMEVIDCSDVGGSVADTGSKLRGGAASVATTSMERVVSKDTANNVSAGDYSYRQSPSPLPAPTVSRISTATFARRDIGERNIVVNNHVLVEVNINVTLPQDPLSKSACASYDADQADDYPDAGTWLVSLKELVLSDSTSFSSSPLSERKREPMQFERLVNPHFAVKTDSGGMNIDDRYRCRSSTTGVTSVTFLLPVELSTGRTRFGPRKSWGGQELILKAALIEILSNDASGGTGSNSSIKGEIGMADIRRVAMARLVAVPLLQPASSDRLSVSVYLRATATPKNERLIRNYRREILGGVFATMALLLAVVLFAALFEWSGEKGGRSHKNYNHQEYVAETPIRLHHENLEVLQQSHTQPSRESNTQEKITRFELKEGNGVIDDVNQVGVVHEIDGNDRSGSCLDLDAVGVGNDAEESIPSPPSKMNCDVPFPLRFCSSCAFSSGENPPTREGISGEGKGVHQLLGPGRDFQALGVATCRVDEAGVETSEKEMPNIDSFSPSIILPSGGEEEYSPSFQASCGFDGLNEDQTILDHTSAVAYGGFTTKSTDKKNGVISVTAEQVFNECRTALEKSTSTSSSPLSIEAHLRTKHAPTGQLSRSLSLSQPAVMSNFGPSATKSFPDDASSLEGEAGMTVYGHSTKREPRRRPRSLAPVPGVQIRLSRKVETKPMPQVEPSEKLLSFVEQMDDSRFKIHPVAPPERQHLYDQSKPAGTAEGDVENRKRDAEEAQPQKDKKVVKKAKRDVAKASGLAVK